LAVGRLHTAGRRVSLRRLPADHPDRHYARSMR